jgi:hypothetical protein
VARRHWWGHGSAVGVPSNDKITFSTRSPAMSKSQDAKKTTKKEPAKTMKEKKAAKKVKKEEKKRQ